MHTPQSHQAPKKGVASRGIHRTIGIATLAVAGLVHTPSTLALDESKTPEGQVANMSVDQVRQRSVDAASLIHTESHVHSEIIENIPVGFIKDGKLQKVTSNIPLFHFTKGPDGTLIIDMTAFLELATDDKIHTAKLHTIKQEILSDFIEKFTTGFPESKGGKQIFMYCTEDCTGRLNVLFKDQKIKGLHLFPVRTKKDVAKNSLTISPVDLGPNQSQKELKISIPLVLGAGGIGAILGALSTWYLGRRRRKTNTSNEVEKVTGTPEPIETLEEYAILIPQNESSNETTDRIPPGEMLLSAYISGNMMESGKKGLVEYLENILEKSTLTTREDVEKMVILLELDPKSVVRWQKTFVIKNPVPSDEMHDKIVDPFHSIQHIHAGFSREDTVRKLLGYVNLAKTIEAVLVPENMDMLGGKVTVGGLESAIDLISATPDNGKVNGNITLSNDTEETKQEIDAPPPVASEKATQTTKAKKTVTKTPKTTATTSGETGADGKKPVRTRSGKTATTPLVESGESLVPVPKLVPLTDIQKKEAEIRKNSTVAQNTTWETLKSMLAEFGFESNVTKNRDNIVINYGKGDINGFSIFPGGEIHGKTEVLNSSNTRLTWDVVKAKIQQVPHKSTDPVKK